MQLGVCLFSYLRASGLFRIIDRGAGEGLYDFVEKCLLIVGEKVHTETVSAALPQQAGRFQ